jgi:hypothetical protein
VSSRVQTAFSDAFGQNPGVLMEANTKYDIEKYIKRTLEATASSERQRAVLSSGQTEVLLDNLQKSSDGNFLWVKLVVQNVVTMHLEGRTFDEIQVFVDRLPSEMLQLYQSISETVDPLEAGNYGRLIRFVMSSSITPLNSVTLWLTDDIPLPGLAGEGWSKEGQDRVNRILKEQLQNATKGILELSSDGIIDFVHQSAQDWFFEDDPWKSLFDKTPDDFDPFIGIIKAWSKQLLDDRLADNLPVSKLSFWEPILIFLSYASRVGDTTLLLPFLVEILDQLDVIATHRANRLAGRYVSCKIPDLDGDASTQAQFTTGSNYTSLHWSLSQDSWPAQTENCFVGIAAQFALLPYVKFKFKENPDLLKSGASRRLLLENAIFGWRNSMYQPRDDLERCRTVYSEDVFEVETRLSLINTLTQAGAKPQGQIQQCASLQGSSFSAQIASLREDQKNRLGPKEHWDSILAIVNRPKKKTAMMALRRA